MTAPKRIDAAAFKRLASEGLPDASELVLCKSGPGDAEPASDADGAGNILTFTISTADVDREGDTIAVDGWELENFRRGGAVLWAHLWDQPPIATPLRTWIDGGKLKSTAKFTPADLNPFGHMIGQLAASGFSRATSVGFRPRKWTENRERGGFFPTDFLEQELTEWSVVNVPANPEALMDARGLGISLAPMKDFASKLLDGGSELGPYLTRAVVEDLYRIGDDRKAVTVDLGAPAKVTEPQPGALSYDAAHKHGTLLADDSREWHFEPAPELLAPELAEYGAWKGDCHYPHHFPEDGSPVSLAGVREAIAAVNNDDLSDGDRRVALDHLAQHLREFGLTDPLDQADQDRVRAGDRDSHDSTDPDAGQNDKSASGDGAPTPGSDPAKPTISDLRAKAQEARDAEQALRAELEAAIKDASDALCALLSDYADAVGVTYPDFRGLVGADLMRHLTKPADAPAGAPAPKAPLSRSTVLTRDTAQTLAQTIREAVAAGMRACGPVE